MKKGIDVSYSQKKIDWKKVAKSGVEFAMIRAGFGWENPDEQTDKYFHTNMKGAKEAGISVGCYLYSYATNVSEAEKEADFLINIIKEYRMDYPVAYDIEDRVQRNLSRDTLTDMALAFCKKIEKAGYRPALYANLEWVRNRFDMDRLKNYPLWIAQYYNTCTYNGKYAIWQYTSSGQVDGICGNVDMDYCYEDMQPTKLIKQAIKKSTAEIVNEVIAGKWGNGGERKSKLTAAGYNFDDIQTAVNSKYKKPTLKPITEIASEVVAGKWGNGTDRKNKLQSAGYNYDAVQAAVNAKLCHKKPAMRTGARVKYHGHVYADSYGGGQGATVSGTYTVQRIIDGRKCGVLLPSGWVSAKDCEVIA